MYNIHKYMPPCLVYVPIVIYGPMYYNKIIRKGETKKLLAKVQISKRKLNKDCHIKAGQDDGEWDADRQAILIKAYRCQKLKPLINSHQMKGR